MLLKLSCRFVPSGAFILHRELEQLAVSYLMQRIGASVGTEYNRDLVLVVTILKVFEHMQLWLLHSYVLLLVTCMQWERFKQQWVWISSDASVKQLKASSLEIRFLLFASYYFFVIHFSSMVWQKLGGALECSYLYWWCSRKLLLCEANRKHFCH